MARPSSILIPIGILMLAWSTCSTAAALSLEDRFQQLQENNAAMKETQAAFEADLIELKAKDRQMGEIMESLVNEIKELKEKVAGLEAQLQQQNQHNLVATSSFDSPTGSDESKHQPRSINGMPSSCGDLQMIGHSWNGLYSVMGLRAVETVYCDFNKPLDDPAFQKWIGYQDVKSKPVYFYVQKNLNFSTPNVPIPFERVIINSGDGMVIGTGIFTAPVKGTYYFSFAGLVQFSVSTAVLRRFNVVIYHNGVAVGRTQLDEVNGIDNPYYLSPLTIQSTMTLQEGDQVWLQSDIVDGGFLWDTTKEDSNHFNGWLLEEEILGSL